MPVRADEIVMDTVTMADLKIADEIGAKVALDLRVGESVVTEEFYLSGWYETNHAFQTKTGQLIVSESMPISGRIHSQRNAYLRILYMDLTRSAYY